MIFADTNYAIRYRYLCILVHCIKICFLLHAHKFRMTGMCDEWKLIGIHVNNKILFLNVAFLHKYMVALTAKQLGSLQPIYDIY
jgi:hypothetical protein